MRFKDKITIGRKPYSVYRMIPLSVTLSDHDPNLKVTTFFKVEYLKKWRVLGTIRLSYHTNRKPYLT